MQTRSFAERLVAAWPALPYAALGFWVAWNLLAYTGAVWVSEVDFDAVYRKQLYILTMAAFALALIVMALYAKHMEGLLSKRRYALLGGAVSSVGSALVILVGPVFFGAPLAALGINRVLYFAGCILAGIGNAMVVVKCADSYGHLLPRTAIVHAAQALIVTVATYFLAIGFPGLRFFESGPLVIGTGAFVTLPIIAGMLASLAPAAGRAEPAPAYSTDRTSVPPSFWRMVVVASFLTFASALVESYANSVVTMAESSPYANLAILLQIPVALAFIFVAVAHRTEKRGFGNVFSAIMVILAMAVVLTPVAGMYYAPSYQMLPFVMRIFEFTVRCLLFFVIFQRQISALVVFGFGYGSISLANAIGWVVGSMVLAESARPAVVAGICVGLAFLALASAFLLFSSKDFENLFESVAEGQASLSSLMERRIDAGMPLETHRGKFKIAIDIIADEYRLSRREKDVLRHLAMGHDATRTAEELGVSWNTVRTHTRNLYSKLDVHSKQELVQLVDSYRSGS